MSNDGGKVCIDADVLIKWLDDGEAWQKKGRELFSTGFTSRPAEVPASIDFIEWKLKGGTLANADDDWAWTFVAERDGSIPPSRQQLIEHLKRYGKVSQAGYEISLSKDSKFLNRKKLPTK